jgi:predicted lipoprotein with Yx(FWY)xxD motif
VLVDGAGRTLYVFVPDEHRKVTCVGTCAQVWPPVKVSATKPEVAQGASASLAGSDPDPEGGRVATYGGWPLYRYAGDGSGGTASGQGLNINGGLWYVIGPSGTVIKKVP